MNKKRLRENYITKRNQMSEEIVLELSNKIIHSLINTELFNSSHEIFTYVSFKNEVRTLELINYALQKSKKVAVPKIVGKGKMYFYYIHSMKDLSIGTYQLLEPTTNVLAAPKKDTLMIMPGVVFDKDKNRIGFGGGFYDRYLEDLVCHTIALCYDYQVIQEKIPVSHNDVKPQMIITEKRKII